jgi:APA family basic amino acid/polyamine antiporter
VLFFYALTFGVIFFLRKKRPDIDRPYKAFAYPVLPAIYILMAVTFCVFLIWMKPVYTVAGLIITLMGIPLYFWAMRNKKASSV